MSAMQDLARLAMTAKTISDQIKEIGDHAKGALHDLMAEQGAERVRVTDENGTDFGTATMSAGRVGARISDPVAFLAWVAERYPDQIVQTVSPAFADRLLACAARKGDPVDEQGEVMPGVTVECGASYVAVRPTGPAKERAAELLAQHLPAITAGSAS